MRGNDMTLAENKSALARLLAGENITVAHEKVSTAYFDLQNRRLVCPIWKDMDGDLYDLLMGHEVGHALETPEQGWHDAIQANKEYKKFKTFLNVIEDARIERKIKQRYPGLARSFASAYKRLVDQDFFGINKLDDLNKLNLIDRINIRFKLSPHVAVSFTDTEREFVQRVNTAETWQEVEQLARDVYAYVAANEADKLNNIQDIEDYIGEKNREQQEQDNLEFQDSDDEEESEDYDADDFSPDDSDDDGELENQDEQSDTTGGGDGSQDDSEEIESITDHVFRAKERELVNETGVVVMAEMPIANLSKIIKPNKTVVDDFEKYIRLELRPDRGGTVYARHNVTFEQIVSKSVAKFLKNNKKFITHMHLEFERRKQASQYARTTQAKTGELDMNKLSNYKFSNDLFKKISVVGKGKSHGMVLFVDMSGSMHRVFGNTIEQLLVLTSFCRLANIPYDVYGFSNDCSQTLHNCGLIGGEKFITNNKTDFQLPSAENFHLLHLIGSDLNPLAHKRAYNMLAVLAAEYNKYEFRNWEAAGLSLDGTPFLETLVASREIIDQFNQRHGRDITNVVYLTDGDGSTNVNFPKPSNGQDIPWYGIPKGVVAYLVDKKTKKKVRVNDRNHIQSALTQLVAASTGCKHIGFYLANQYDVRSFIKANNNNHKLVTEMRKTLRDHNFFAIPHAGYSRYFVTPVQEGEIQEKVLNVNNGMTRSQMAKAFKSALGSKKSSRVLISRFAEEISA
jgi:inhibitor of KinA sporulation pathway (predicted exonuclease)